MKLALSILLLASSASAFSVVAPARQSSVRASSTSALDATSRRDMLSNAGAAIAASLLATAQPALARETYLVEPTEEFKQNEAKAMEFKRAQLKIKADFLRVLDRFTNESKTEEQIVDDLADLAFLVKRTGGLPLGIKKEELFKIVRRKKAGPTWSVKTEYG